MFSSNSRLLQLEARGETGKQPRSHSLGETSQVGVRRQGTADGRTGTVHEHATGQNYRKAVTVETRTDPVPAAEKPSRKCDFFFISKSLPEMVDVATPKTEPTSGKGSDCGRSTPFSVGNVV
ncbi:hypothetical protein CRENBAI_000750 [Crenichthys baileyi]|uniref:Uncharacterized protein n=1 Tax=Crenichthys baileyi TaxID=28760 RepID=A0AAV9RT52_9TELE